MAYRAWHITNNPVVTKKKRLKEMNRPNLSKKLSVFLLIPVILLATNLVILGQSQTSDSSKSIVLFSWDGVERKVFFELLNDGQLPFVESLTSIINHTCTPAMDMPKATDTRSQHACMLSGYLPETTGIYRNDPEFNPSGLSLPGGYSLFERVREWSDDTQTIGNRLRIAGGTGKPKNVADLLGFPQNETGYHYNKKGFNIFYYDWKRVGGYPPEMPAPQVNMTSVFLEIAINETPFLYFFHFSDPDHVGHKYGVNSTQYKQAIINCDQATEKICQKLESSNPAIIVTSDHGFGKPIPTQHSGTPETFLATNLPITVTQSYMPDVAVTIYAYLGIDYTQFKPIIEGESLMRGRPRANWRQFFYWNGTDSIDGNKFYLEPQHERWKIRWNYIPKWRVRYSYYLTFHVYMKSADSYYLYDTVTTEGNLTGQHAFLEPPPRQFMVHVLAHNIEYLELWGEEDLLSTVPEFPSLLILLLFMMATTLLAAIYRRKYLKFFARA